MRKQQKSLFSYSDERKKTSFLQHIFFPRKSGLSLLNGIWYCYSCYFWFWWSDVMWIRDQIKKMRRHKVFFGKNWHQTIRGTTDWSKIRSEKIPIIMCHKRYCCRWWGGNYSVDQNKFNPNDPILNPFFRLKYSLTLSPVSERIVMLWWKIIIKSQKHFGKRRADWLPLKKLSFRYFKDKRNGED